jgi:hypothetical protein
MGPGRRCLALALNDSATHLAMSKDEFTLPTGEKVTLIYGAKHPGKGTVYLNAARMGPVDEKSKMAVEFAHLPRRHPRQGIVLNRPGRSARLAGSDKKARATRPPRWHSICPPECQNDQS